MDDSILPSQHFFTSNATLPITKYQLGIETDFELSSFLVGVMHFVVTNRVGQNATGAKTLQFWGEKVSNKPMNYNSYPFGNSIKHTITVDYPKAMAISKPKKSILPANLNIDKDPILFYIDRAGRYFENIATIVTRDSKACFSEVFVCGDLGTERFSNPRFPKRIPNATIRKLENYSHHIRFTGCGGIGKTMMMRHLFFSGIEVYKDTGVLPIYIEIRSFKITDDSIELFILRSMKEFSPNIDDSAILKLISENKVALLFDGLDELTDRSRDRFKLLIDEFIRVHLDITIIFSSRPFERDSYYTGFDTLDCMKLTLDQAIELIRRLPGYEDDEKDRFIEILTNDLYPNYPDYAGIALLLQIMFMAYTYYGEIHMNLPGFYSQAYDTLSVSHDRLKSGFLRRFYTSLSVSEFTSYISEFAYRAYSRGMMDFTEEEFCEIMSEVLKHRHVSTGALPIDFLYDATTSVCVLYFEANKYHFLHRSFQEYLTAVHLKNNLAGNYENIRKYFEEERHGYESDATFEMLYEMKQYELDVNLFYPYLNKMVRSFMYDEEGNKLSMEDAYWKYCMAMHPRIVIRKLPSIEEIEGEENRERFERWTTCNTIDYHSNQYGSVLFNAFLKKHNFCSLDKLEQSDFEPWFIVQNRGTTFSYIRDCDNWGTYLSETYLSIHDTTRNGKEMKTYAKGRLIGSYFIIETSYIYSNRDGDTSDAYDHMTDCCFPIREEFDSILSWLKEMKVEVASYKRSRNTVEALCK